MLYQWRKRMFKRKPARTGCGVDAGSPTRTCAKSKRVQRRLTRALGGELGEEDIASSGARSVTTA
jgi:hypothetical protein